MDTRSILTLTGILVGIFLFHVKIVKDDLKEDASREYFLAKMRDPTYTRLYRESLKRALDWIDEYFHGANPFSFAAFSLIVPIALNYCSWFFLLGWVAGGSGEFGTAQLLPHAATQWEKLAALVGFACSPLLSFWLAKSFWWRAYADETLRATLTSQFGKLPDYKNLPFPREALAFLVVFVCMQSWLTSLLLYSIRDSAMMVYALTGYASLVGLSSAFLVSAPVRTAVDRQLFKVGAAATLILFVVGMLAGNIMFYVNGGALPYTASLTLFCVFLPFACAASDFVAWAIARTLGRRLLPVSGVTALFIHLVLNSIAAVCCILAGIVVLIFCVDALDGIYKRQLNFSPFSVSSVISAVETTPRQADNAWLLGHLVVTMMPIFLHLAAVLAGLLTTLTPESLREAVARRIAGASSNAQLTLPAVYIAVIPWLSVACIVILAVTLYTSLDAFRTQIVTQLLSFARGTHQFVTSYLKEIVVIGVLVHLVAWLHSKRRSSPAAKQSTEISNSPSKKPGKGATSSPSTRTRRKRRAG